MNSDPNHCGICGEVLEDSPVGELCPRCLFGSLMMGSEILEPFDELIEAPDIDIPNTIILNRLGSGAMATVFRARQTLLQRDVAVKVISPRFSKDTEFIERFFREAQTMAQLDHSGIAGLFEIGETVSGDLYLIMELVEGESIQARLGRERIPPKVAIRWAMQVCNALSYAHQKGVVHRDIKPSNLLIDREDNVKLVDFGISRLANIETSRETLTATSASLGTPEYIAPEQLDDTEPQDHRVDIYALGVTFYQMLTGVMPRGMWYFPSKSVEGVDQRFDRVIDRVLQNDPGKRYQSAHELEVDLRKLLVKPTRVAGWIFAGLGLAMTAYLGGFATPWVYNRSSTAQDERISSDHACPVCGAEELAGGWLVMIKGPHSGPDSSSERPLKSGEVIGSIEDVRFYSIQVDSHSGAPTSDGTDTLQGILSLLENLSEE